MILAIGVSACGSSEPAASLAPNNVLETADITRYPQGSVERAFTEFWSGLQFRSWADVASFYDPAFRDAVGTAVVIGAKKVEAPSYPMLKPSIVRLKESPEETTLYYAVRLPDGRKDLSSITWRENDGNWQIVYDSRLDPELSQLAQNRVELKTAGVLPAEASDVSAQALRAADAAGRIQARFLEQELDQG